MNGMKIALIGCDPLCVYFAKAVLQHADAMQIERLVLFDESEERLSAYGGLLQKLTRLLHTRVRFTAEKNLVQASIGAEYVFVLDTPGRAEDERDAQQICTRAGACAELPFGAGAYLTAKRALPAVEEYCAYAKKYGKPNIKVGLFLPAAGLLLQALRARGYTFTFAPGLSAARTAEDIARILKIDRARLDASCVGVSGFTLFSAVTVDQKEILPQLLENDVLVRGTDARFFDRSLLLTRGVLPDRRFTCVLSPESPYRGHGGRPYYDAEQALDEKSSLLFRLLKTDMNNTFDAALGYINEFADALRDGAEEFYVTAGRKPFSPFDLENTPAVNETLRFMEALRSEKTERVFLLAPEGGAASPLGKENPVQTACEVSSAGIRAARAGLRDPFLTELLTRAASSERRLAGALVRGDETAAVEALALCPGIGSLTVAEAVLRRAASTF